MNKDLLIMAAANLDGWLRKSREETVTVDQKLDAVMWALSDLCKSLAAETYDEADAMLDRIYARREG